MSGDSRRFTTAFDANFRAFAPVINNRAACGAMCELDDACQGLFVWTTGANQLSCVGLTSLGDINGVSYFGDSVSYLKTPENEQSTTMPVSTTPIVYPCESDPCENGATCENLLGDIGLMEGSGDDGEEMLEYICLCPFGFEGERCEVSINSTTIIQQTTPVDTTTSPTTSTATSTTTSTTSTATTTTVSTTTSTTSTTVLENPCDAAPCLNGATCSSPGPGLFNCACPPLQFFGPNCEEPLRECSATQYETAPPTASTNRQCASLPCSLPLACRHGGACLNVATADGGFAAECTCPRDVTGAQCENLPADRLPGGVDTATGATYTWNGTASPPLQLLVGPSFAGAATGDVLLLTADHIAVLAGSNALSQVTTRTLDAAAVRVALPQSSEAWRAVALDHDGDGRQDLALFNAELDSARLLWLGTGFVGLGPATSGDPPQSFPSAQQVALPPLFPEGDHAIWAVAAADVNGDGREDLLEVTSQGACVTWRSGHEVAVGCAADASLAQVSAVTAAAGDLNGDGRADLVVATSLASGAASVTLYVWDSASASLRRETSRALPAACTGGASVEVQYAGGITGTNSNHVAVRCGCTVFAASLVLELALPGTPAPFTFQQLFVEDDTRRCASLLTVADLNTDGVAELALAGDGLDALPRVLAGTFFATSNGAASFYSASRADIQLTAGGAIAAAASAPNASVWLPQRSLAHDLTGDGAPDTVVAVAGALTIVTRLAPTVISPAREGSAAAADGLQAARQLVENIAPVVRLAADGAAGRTAQALLFVPPAGNRTRLPRMAVFGPATLVAQAGQTTEEIRVSPAEPPLDSLRVVLLGGAVVHSTSPAVRLQVAPLNAHGGTTRRDVRVVVKVTSNGRELQHVCNTQGAIAGCQLEVSVPPTWFLDGTTSTAQLSVEAVVDGALNQSPLLASRFLTLIRERALLSNAYVSATMSNAVAVLSPGRPLDAGASGSLVVAVPRSRRVGRLELRLTPGDFLQLGATDAASGWLVTRRSDSSYVATRVGASDGNAAALVPGSNGQLEEVFAVRVRAAATLSATVESSAVGVNIVSVASVSGMSLTAVFGSNVRYFRDGRSLEQGAGAPIALRPRVPAAVMVRPMQYALLNYGAIDTALAALTAVRLDTATLYTDGSTGEGSLRCSSGQPGQVRAAADCASISAAPSAAGGSTGVQISLEVTSGNAVLSSEVTVALYHPFNLRLVPGRTTLAAPSMQRHDVTRLHLLADFSDSVMLYANADVAPLLAGRIQATGPTAGVARVAMLDGVPALVAVSAGAVLLQLQGAANSGSGVALPEPVIVGVINEAIGAPGLPVGLAFNQVGLAVTMTTEGSVDQGIAVYNAQATLSATVDPSATGMASVVLHDASRLELRSDDHFATRLWSEEAPSPVQLASGLLELRRLPLLTGGDPNFALVPVSRDSTAGSLRPLARVEAAFGAALVYGTILGRDLLAAGLDEALLLAQDQASNYAAATGLASTALLQFDDASVDLIDVAVSVAPGSSGRVLLERQSSTGRWTVATSPDYVADAAGATGPVQLNVAYRGLSLQLDVDVTAVLASRVEARLEGLEREEAWANAIQIRPYANAGAGNALTFQRYGLRLQMELADGETTLIAESGTVTYTLPSVGAAHLVLSSEPAPMLTAARNGAVTGVLAFVGDMEPARIPLAVAINLNDAVAVTALDVDFPSTVAEAFALNATVATSDGATVVDAFASGWNMRTRAITLAVSGAGQRALRTDAGRGFVEATANAAGTVLLLAAAGEVTASASVAVNMPLSRVGDADLGPTEGPGAVLLSGGVTTVPVYVNSGGADLSAVQMLLAFGSSELGLVEILAVSPGDDWAGGELVYGIAGTSVDFGGLCRIEGGSRVHIANVRVRGAVDGSDEVTGRVDVLLSADGQALHRSGDDAAIVAGRMLLSVSGAGAAGRRRRSSSSDAPAPDGVRQRRASCDALPDLDDDCRVTLLDVLLQSSAEPAAALDVNQDGVVDDADTSYLFAAAFNVLPVVATASATPVSATGGLTEDSCAAAWQVELVDSRGNPLPQSAADVIFVLQGGAQMSASALRPSTFSPALSPERPEFALLAVSGTPGRAAGLWQAQATLAEEVADAGMSFVIAMRDASTRPQPVATTALFARAASAGGSLLDSLNATAVSPLLSGEQVPVVSRGPFSPFLSWSSDTSTPACLALGRDEAPAADDDEAVPVFGWALIGVCAAMLVLLVGLLAVRRRRQNVYEVCVLSKQLFVEGETDHPWAGRGHTLGYAVRKAGAKKFTRGMDLILERGKTYRFRMMDVGSDYPFYFSYSETGGGNGVAEYLHGVQGTPAIDGDVVTFTPPSDCPNQLYYQCTKQKCMGYRVRVVDANRLGPSSNGSSSALLTAEPFAQLSGSSSTDHDEEKAMDPPGPLLLQGHGQGLDADAHGPSMLSFRNDNSLEEVLAGEQASSAGATEAKAASGPPNYRPPPSFGASAAQSGGVLGLGQPPLETFAVPPPAVSGAGNRERRAPQYVPPPVYPLAVQYGAAQRPSGQGPSDAVYLPPPPYVRAYNLLRASASRDLDLVEKPAASGPQSTSAFLADPNDGMAPSLHLPGLRSNHEPYETHDEDVHVALASPGAQVRPGQAVIRRLEHRRPVMEFSEDDGPTTFSSFA